MHRSSVFKLKIDFEKSRNSILFDKNSGREFLDFFGMYSTVTLGYSHPVFKDPSFAADVLRIAHLRTTNCEMASSEAQNFFEKFSAHPAMQPYKNFHFSCTGALGIEAAIKIAIDQKKTLVGAGKAPMKVISLKESFHGINGYGGFLTDRFPPVSRRLTGFPDMGWPKIHNPKIIYKNNAVDLAATEEGLQQFKKEFHDCLEKIGAENIAALLIEPIQSTAGDHYFPQNFFNLIRELCDRHNIFLIFDEIQTGFGATGQMWFYQQVGIQPDLVVFGKKAQVCGVMFKEEINETLKNPIRLEVTWDGELIDMIRSAAILKAFEKYNILENVRARGAEILEGLKKNPELLNVRGLGLLIAFDFETSAQQEAFCQRAFENGLLFNKTRERTLRFRPNLNVSAAEVESALEKIRKSL